MNLNRPQGLVLIAEEEEEGKEINTKFNKIMAVSVLLYGPETRAVKTKCRACVQAAEMAFLGRSRDINFIKC
jgi:hypothetical protein